MRGVYCWENCFAPSPAPFPTPKRNGNSLSITHLRCRNNQLPNFSASSLQIPSPELLSPCCESIALNRLPHAPHQILIKVQIVNRRQCPVNRFIRKQQMPQIRTAESLSTRRAAAGCVDRITVLAKRLVLQPHLPVPRKYCALPRIPSRYNAVENIHPTFHRRHDGFHQFTRTFIHHFTRFDRRFQ